MFSRCPPVNGAIAGRKPSWRSLDVRRPLNKLPSLAEEPGNRRLRPLQAYSVGSRYPLAIACNRAQCFVEMAHGSLDVPELFEAEQADAEGLEVRSLIALQGYPSRRLQPELDESLAGVQADVVGIAHNYARSLESCGGDARVAAPLEQCTHRLTKLLLLGTQPRKAAGTRLEHRVACARERVSGHRRVVEVRAAFVGLHDLQPFPEVGGEAGARRGFDPGTGGIGEHHEGAAGRSAPAFLRGADEHVHAG